MFNFKNPFKALSKVMKTGASASNIAKSTNLATIGSLSKGIIDYNPTNINYMEASAKNTEGNKFFVYPTDEVATEHYMLFDVIKRDDETKLGRNESLIMQDNISGGVNNPGATVGSKRLNTVIYGANRFFGEGGKIGIIPTGKGAARSVVSSMAIYMPQTLNFNFAADYGPAEIGIVTGAIASLRDFFSPDGSSENLKSIAQQAAKGVIGASTFLTGGLASGTAAGLQRRTGLAPAAMTEMIFNGIDYRTFSFEFKFTPRSKKESDIVKNMIREFKLGMLPTRYGKGSIAAYKVPYEFVIRFMQGTKVNPYIEQLGLCALTEVSTDYGDKFSTHSSGDPVTTNLKLTFRELELIEKERYKELNPY